MSNLDSEVAALRRAIGYRCECRFDDDGSQLSECHYHECQRKVRLSNGDPSGVTWEAYALRLKEELEPLEAAKRWLAKELDDIRFYSGTTDATYKRLVSELAERLGITS